MDNSIGVNDIIATRDNQRLRVLRVIMRGNDIFRLEAVDDNAPTPMRTNVSRDNFLRVLLKCPWKFDKMGNKIDSKTGKPWTEEAVK